VLTKIQTEVVRQPEARVRRAWYHSVSSDVVLLHDAETGTLLSFEIEWEGRGCRRAYLVWGRAVGLRTGRIDMGEGSVGFSYKASPVVIWDFRLRPEYVVDARRLVERSGIEEGLRESVLRRLDGHP
jgi:hypothetical protein